MERVIEIFREICAIPHGSENMEGISTYCADFGQRLGLEVIRDEAKNVILKKKGSCGMENAAPLILQGHMDMVCQKDPDVSFDFETEGLRLKVEGDRLYADGTTLGGDNGIAVALILALLEREDLAHPPLEAVLTVDEEIGMIGAMALDASLLSGKRLINLDSEDDTVTVSCAGGSDFILTYPITREKKTGKALEIRMGGLQGGHSGIEIHKGRVNCATFMGRFLSLAAGRFPLSLVELESGEKTNAIPFHAKATVIYEDEALIPFAKEALASMKREIAFREPNFTYEIKELGEGAYDAVESEASGKIFDALCTVPTGVIAMSPSIDDLVETSLNLGILETSEARVKLHFYLRSNSADALSGLEETMLAFARLTHGESESSGYYPPWEYSENSPLRETYLAVYREETGRDVPVVALHAGLECGVFGAKIEGLDCIAIGPNLYDVHTPKESMSLSSVEKIYHRLVTLLSRLG